MHLQRNAWTLKAFPLVERLVFPSVHHGPFHFYFWPYYLVESTNDFSYITKFTTTFLSNKEFKNLNIPTNIKSIVHPKPYSATPNDYDGKQDRPARQRRKKKYRERAQREACIHTRLHTSPSAIQRRGGTLSEATSVRASMSARCCAYIQQTHQRGRRSNTRTCGVDERTHSNLYPHTHVYYVAPSLKGLTRTRSIDLVFNYLARARREMAL